VEETASIQIEDGMLFQIKSVATNIDEADYSGIRVMLDATLEMMHIHFKMRDYYDTYALETTQKQNIDETVLREAFANTSKERGSFAIVRDTVLILPGEQRNFRLMEKLTE
jgi:hypothetical protein